MIEYQVLQFLTAAGPLFIAVGVVLLTGVVVFGVGRTRHDAVEDMKQRAPEITAYRQREDSSKD